MTFRQRNASATFQKIMDFIFQKVRKFAGAYIGEILFYSKTLEEHLQALRKVYDKFREECFIVGPDKCTWAHPEVE